MTVELLALNIAAVADPGGDPQPGGCGRDDARSVLDELNAYEISVKLHLEGER